MCVARVLSVRQQLKQLDNARNDLSMGQQSVTVNGVTYTSEAKIDEEIARLREAERVKH